MMIKRVLVVDDDAGVCRFLHRAVKSMGMEFVSSATVEDALQKCSDDRYDVVMLDYNLFEGEIGWSVAPVIRDDPEVYGSPGIVGMSGTVDLAIVDQLGFSKKHFDAFLAKPFELSKLKKLFDELLNS